VAQKNLGTGAIPTATTIDGSDRLLGTSGGLSKEIPASIMPVSTPVAAALAAKLNASESAPLRSRSTHTGNDPAANVLIAATGETLEQYVARLEIRLTSLGSSAPVNTVQPTAPTGTKTVGQTLTAVTGTWSGASTYLYVWYRVYQTTGVFTATGGAGSTYLIQSADYGYFMACSIAGVSAAGVQAAAVMSAVTTAVGSTLATNSVAPSLSGSATAGSTITWNVGTWANASTYSVQIYAAGVPIGARTSAAASTTGTFSSTNGQVGLALTCSVIAYNATGVASATDVASSNSITVTGAAPTVANTVAPAWPATVFLNVQAVLTVGTWTGTINPTRTYDFYKTSITQANLLRSGNTVAVFTPHNPESTGLALAAGETVYFVETVTETATGNTFSASSAGKVLSATPAGLALTQAQTGITWTASSAITSVQPITATGGTTPYTWSIDTSPAAGTGPLPSGLTMNSATGIISGTPGGAVSQNTYTVKVVDSAGSPATATASFTATVNAASVAPLAALTPSNWEGNGGSFAYSGQTILGTDGVVRVQRIDNFQSTGKRVYLHRVASVDATYFSGQRSEFSWYTPLFGAPLQLGVDYWFAFAIRPLAGEWSVEDGITWQDQTGLWQIHGYHDNINGPTAIIHHDVTASGPMRLFTGHGEGGYSFTNENLGAIMPEGSWTKFIVHARFGPTTGYAPIRQVWRNGTLTINVSGSSALWGAVDDLGFYPKIGFYRSSGTIYGPNGAPINSRAAYYSELYYGAGVSLYSEAEASLAGL
jgi:hypothetical protein